MERVFCRVRRGEGSLLFLAWFVQENMSQEEQFWIVEDIPFLFASLDLQKRGKQLLTPDFYLTSDCELLRLLMYPILIPFCCLTMCNLPSTMLHCCLWSLWIALLFYYGNIIFWIIIEFIILKTRDNLGYDENVHYCILNWKREST